MTVVALPACIAAEVARLDMLIIRAVLAMRMRRALSTDEFCGIRISDEQIDAALSAQGRPLPGFADDPRPPLPEVGPLTQWQDIAARLNLTPVEEDVLLLASLPQIDRRYETVFAYLNDQMGAGVPTVDLILRIFEGVPDVADALAPGGRLARVGALEIARSETDGTSAWRARRVLGGEAVALRLLGAGWPAADLGFDAIPDTPIPQPAPPITGQAPLLHITGSGAEMRQRKAALELSALGYLPVKLNLDHTPNRAEIRRMALAARLWKLALILPGATPDVCAGCLAHWPADLPLAQQGGRTPSSTNRPVLSIHANPLPQTAAAACWRAAAGCAVDAAERLARDFDLGPRQIEKIASVVALTGTGEASLVAAARAARLVDFGPLARQVSTEDQRRDLILPTPTARAIDDFSKAIIHRRQVLIDWGFSSDRGGGALSGLLTGPSGTGKTMAAAHLARAAGLNLYRIDLSAVVDKYIGETEKNLERVFDAAESSEAMLLFDEADALFGKRSETREARDRYANLEVSYLLQRIETLPPGIVVVLTTNMAKNMDPAFARRLTHVIDFPHPPADLRRRMWAGIFPERTPLADGLNLDPVADLFDLTGGEIRQVALDAAFRAAAAKRPVGQTDLINALRRHHEKAGRALPERALARLVASDVQPRSAAE